MARTALRFESEAMRRSCDAAALLLMSLGTQAPRHTDASVSMMNIRPYLICKTLQEIIPKVTLLYHYSPTNGEQRNR